MDDMHLRDNLMVDALPLRIVDREVKQLRGKEITIVKVVWGGLAGGSMTWESESRMKEAHPNLFLSDNFRWLKSSNWGRVVTPCIIIMSPQKHLRSELAQKQKDHCNNNIEHLSELLIVGAEADLEHIVKNLMTLHVIYSELQLDVNATQ